MDIVKLRDLLKGKNYPNNFIEDIILFYPLMVRNFSEEKIDIFFREWNIVFNNELHSFSCGTYKSDKKIVIGSNNLEEYYPHRLITTLFHEVGHTLGTSYIPFDELLSQGHERESFFEKIDEAVVSEKQDDVLCGQLQYNYVNGYGFKCRGDVQHADTYAFEKMYYNVFKILLGNKRDLIYKMFYENNIEEKTKIYTLIKEELKDKLNEEELNILLDSCVSLITNHMYGASISNDCSCERKINSYLKELYDYNYEYSNIKDKSKEEQEEFLKEFKAYSKQFYEKNYGKAVSYLKDRNILEVDISTQSDKLCSMVVDYLIKKNNMSSEVDFDTIKETCEYFVKINNRNVNKEKTNFLLESLYQKLEQLNIRFNNEIEEKYSHEELLGIILKIIAIKDVNLESINNLIIVKESEDSIFLKCNNYLIKVSRKLTNDRIRTFDSSLGNVEVNTTLPNIELNYVKGCTIGDKVKLEELVNSNKTFCQVDINKELQK